MGTENSGLVGTLKDYSYNLDHPSHVKKFDNLIHCQPKNHL